MPIAFVILMVFIAFLTILFVFVVWAVFTDKKMSPTKTGDNLSEWLVYRELLGLPAEYILHNDLLFKSNGRSTQIDHLVVSPYGVFVIETKGYKGWILGGEHSQYWVQTLYSYKFRFYNPILQNEGHVKFLRYLLRSSVDIPFIPIVVFDNRADLKVLAKEHIIVNRRDLIKTIKQFQCSILDSATIDWIDDTIKKGLASTDEDSKEQHTAAVVSTKLEVRNRIHQGICPRCGGQLKLRHGPYSAFYGCSNYPYCKFIYADGAIS